jgi:hypothetical protein
MRLLRTKNPDDVAKLYPWLVPTDTETRMDIASELYGMLKEKPEDTFVFVAIERNITRAVLIAHVLSKRIVWCWQSGAEPGFKYHKYMFNTMTAWAKSKGAKKIGAGFGPDEDRWKNILVKRWGFKEIRNGELRYKL